MNYLDKSFSVAGHRCFGCEQRDVWIERRDEEILRLNQIIKMLKEGHK